MPPGQGHGVATESVLLCALALFLLISPFSAWWMQLTPPWYFPYLLWLGLIGLIALLSRRVGRHDL